MGRVYDTEPENRFGPAPAVESADTATANTADTTPAIPDDDPPPF
jgi:hypothetical protein